MSSPSEESFEEMETRHRKEVKALDGEKRAALKKAKAVKGKKGKEALANVETEFAAKLKTMEERHASEKAANPTQQSPGGEDADSTEPTPQQASQSEEPQLSPEEQERQRKMEKARKKREKQKEKERNRERELAEEAAQAGPSARDTEMSQIRATLTPLQLTIREITADGNCLYRAVASQVSKRDFTQIRAVCADTLQQNSDEFAPFVEYTDDAPDFAAYVERVRSSSDWGGHLELRALAMALKQPIHVYSAAQSQALVIQGEDEETAAPSSGSADPIRLSYHLHYYSLGEHYNEVVAAPTTET